MSAVAEKARLVNPVREKFMPEIARLRDLAALSACRSNASSMDAVEWSRLSREHRIVFLMLAGVDDDVDLIAEKHWREFTQPEVASVKASIRCMRVAMLSVSALVRS